jgi:hypothetical protein
MADPALRDRRDSSNRVVAHGSSREERQEQAGKETAWSEEKDTFAEGPSARFHR